MAQAVQGLTLQPPRLSRDSPYGPSRCPRTHHKVLQAVQGLTIRSLRLSGDSPYGPSGCPGTHCVAKASGSLQCSRLSLQSPVMAGAGPFPSWTTVSFERLWCFPFWMDWALRETCRCVGISWTHLIVLIPRPGACIGSSAHSRVVST